MTVGGHVPVLLEAAVDALVHDPDGTYVDGTFGRGGHARAILGRLSPRGRLVAVGRDPAEITLSTHLLAGPDVASGWKSGRRLAS